MAFKERLLNAAAGAASPSGIPGGCKLLPLHRVRVFGGAGSLTKGQNAESGATHTAFVLAVVARRSSIMGGPVQARQQVWYVKASLRNRLKIDKGSWVRTSSVCRPLDLDAEPLGCTILIIVMVFSRLAWRSR
jgi:hypothetical protein